MTKKSVVESQLMFQIVKNNYDSLFIEKPKDSEKVVFAIRDRKELTELTFTYDELIDLEMLLVDAEELKEGSFKGIVHNYQRMVVSRFKYKADFYKLEIGGCDIVLSEEHYQKLIDVISGLQFILRKTVA